MNKTQIGAKVIAHSKSPQGHEIATMELTFPRFLLAELNTHRMFSKNSASSRAIPFIRMVEAVMENPFIPVAWQKDHKGMQGTEYLTDTLSIQFARDNWLKARDHAVSMATTLHRSDNGYESVTKQLCNRLLEPFMWHKVLLTSTEWENFFNLRCPQYEVEVPEFGFQRLRSRREVFNAVHECEIEMYNDYHILDWLLINKSEAEIHISFLAEAMWDALNESTPVQLKAGEWHIPYKEQFPKEITEYQILASTGKCARASYLTIGNEKEMTVEKLIGIRDKMVAADPFHASPFEHCARVPTDAEYYAAIKTTKYPVYLPTDDKGYGIINRELYPQHSDFADQVDYSMYGWFRNFQGFIQYRHILETGGGL